MLVRFRKPEFGLENIAAFNLNSCRLKNECAKPYSVGFLQKINFIRALLSQNDFNMYTVFVRALTASKLFILL